MIKLLSQKHFLYYSENKRTKKQQHNNTPSFEGMLHDAHTLYRYFPQNQESDLLYVPLSFHVNLFVFSVLYETAAALCIIWTHSLYTHS